MSKDEAIENDLHAGLEFGIPIPNPQAESRLVTKLFEASAQETNIDYAPTDWPFQYRLNGQRTPVTHQDKYLTPAVPAIRPWPFDEIKPVVVTPKGEAAIAKSQRQSEGEAKATAAKKVSEAAKRNRDRLKASLKELRNKHKLEFIHANGTTFAWRTGIQSAGGSNHGRVVEFSTSICHKRDTFTKWVGSALAAQNFEKGAVVRLRVPKAFADAKEYAWWLAHEATGIPMAYEPYDTWNGKDWV